MRRYIIVQVLLSVPLILTISCVVGESRKNSGTAIQMERQSERKERPDPARGLSELCGSSLEGILGEYRSIIEDMKSVPARNVRSGGIPSLRSAVRERINAGLAAQAGACEKFADLAYREYKFAAALQAYMRARKFVGEIEMFRNLRSLQIRYRKKINATRHTGENYLRSKVQGLLNQAEIHNLKDETEKAKEMLTKARAQIEKSPFKTDPVFLMYNSMAKLLKAQTMATLAEVKGRAIKRRRKEARRNKEAKRLKEKRRVQLALSCVRRRGVFHFVNGHCRRAGRSFRNSIGMEFVLIKAGSFLMGSRSGSKNERPVHRVRISKAFYLGKFEVTQGQWKSVMGTEPWRAKKYIREGDDFPAVYVSWYDAQKFIRRLNGREGHGRYRLPTEAQWEYACRAGSQSKYSFGNDSSRLGNYAWYHKNAMDAREKYAHRVGGKRPNSWGLYDMHGNVWEWVNDLYDWKYYRYSPRTDPGGATSIRRRVMRGGSFYHNANYARSTVRDDHRPVKRHFYEGFRLLRSYSVLR